MTSAEYAGDTSLFVGIQNVLLRENGGNFYAYITGTDFFAGTSYGSNLPETPPATYYRNAFSRNSQYKPPTVIITAGVLRRIEIVLKGISPS